MDIIEALKAGQTHTKSLETRKILLDLLKGIRVLPDTGQKHAQIGGRLPHLMQLLPSQKRHRWKRARAFVPFDATSTRGAVKLFPNPKKARHFQMARFFWQISQKAKTVLH